MKKNVKIGLAVGAVVVIIACILLIPFSTFNVDLFNTFGDRINLSKLIDYVNINSKKYNTVGKIIDYLKLNSISSSNSIKFCLYNICAIGAGIQGCSGYTITNSTTDTFDLMSGSKKVSAKLNIKKLWEAMSNIPNGGNWLPVKTNLLHTIFLI